jgi:aspartyl-tRNA(Asn)/glutamyl-tRNA(Gln) amidotransferase subunit C
MPALTRKEVEEIALLARLALEPEELERMQRELGAILEHFDALAAVDTTGVPAMTHAVPMDLRMRNDAAEPSLPVATALAAAPRRDGDLIVVPSSIAPATTAPATTAPAGGGPPGRPGTGPTS